jgi:hypothetical protein
MRYDGRRWIAVLVTTLFWLLPVGTLQAKEAVVTTTDGRQISGEVLSETAEVVVLRVAGIRTPVQRSMIERIEYKKTLAEEYEERRAAVPDNDLDERYKLALWLFEQRAYALAKTELDDLAQRFPDDGRVAHLGPLVEARLKLQREGDPAPSRPAGEAPPRVVTLPPAPVDLAEEKLLEQRLTEEQINLIKVFDVDIETRPRVRIPPEVMREVFVRYAHRDEVPKGRSDQMRFLGAPGWQQLDLLFALRAREYYDQVVISGDPQTVADFRRSIHRQYVLAYCGTRECHGGEEVVGNFFLFNHRDSNDDRTVYTNYLLLNQYESARGYMIDRERPGRSLLLQYGLNQREAAIPHPDVPGWRQRMPNAQHPQFQLMARWIESLGAPAIRYPINYTAPGVTPATPEPAAAPPGAPAPAATPPAPPPRPTAQ